jgi:putative transposase
VRRAFKFRAYPTHPQEGRAVRLLRDHCDLYNAALEEWKPTDGGRWAQATFQAVGQIKVHQHRRVEGRVKTLQLKREYRTAHARRAHLQRRKERAKLGSGNRRRLRRALAKEWRKVRNQRRDFHHKTARSLVDTCDVMALEDLKVDNMTASASGTVEEPGRNVAQKAGLNRSILDAGWGQFTSILVAKAESAGRRVVRVDPSHTSVDCHACGSRCSRPRQDIVVCPNCGEQDADLNGARNIATRAGLGSGQALVA